jgi:hypothetical protein
MSYAPPCPTCPGAVELPPGYIEELVASKRSAGSDLVEEPVYLRRLAACAACASCADGTMCRHCGCFVHLRALSALRDCPHPRGDRWSNV